MTTFSFIIIITTINQNHHHHSNPEDRPRLRYLCDPDEDFELVDVKLLIHAFSEPSPQQIHGGSVPLLKHRGTTPSSKKHTLAHVLKTQQHLRLSPQDTDEAQPPTRTAPPQQRRQLSSPHVCIQAFL